ncbi:MAG: hypothetical protein VB140_08090 [Burkholderia sp.]
MRVNINGSRSIYATTPRHYIEPRLPALQSSSRHKPARRSTASRHAMPGE